MRILRNMLCVLVMGIGLIAWMNSSVLALGPMIEDFTDISEWSVADSNPPGTGTFTTTNGISKLTCQAGGWAYVVAWQTFDFNNYPGVLVNVTSLSSLTTWSVRWNYGATMYSGTGTGSIFVPYSDVEKGTGSSKSAIIMLTISAESGATSPQVSFDFIRHGTSFESTVSTSTYIISKDVTSNGIVINATDGTTGVITYSGTDAATVINNTISTLGTTGGKIVIKKGTYDISSQLVVSQPMQIQGEGKKATILKKMFNGTLLKVYDPNNLRIFPMEIKDLAIDGNGPGLGGYTGDGLYMVAANAAGFFGYTIGLENVRIESNGGDGLVLENVVDFTAVNCEFLHSGGKQIYITGNQNIYTFLGCRSVGGSYALYVSVAPTGYINNLRYIGGELGGASQYGIYLNSVETAVISSHSEGNVKHAWVSGNNVLFLNHQFGNGSETAAPVIEFYYGDSNRVEGCSFRDGSMPTSCIQIDAGVINTTIRRNNKKTSIPYIVDNGTRTRIDDPENYFNIPQMGEVTGINTGTTGIKSGAVTFGTAYPTGKIPTITITLKDPSSTSLRFYDCYVTSVSNTGFTYNVVVGTAAGGSTVKLQWVAQIP